MRRASGKLSGYLKSFTSRSFFGASLSVLFVGCSLAHTRRDVSDIAGAKAPTHPREATVDNKGLQSLASDEVVPSNAGELKKSAFSVDSYKVERRMRIPVELNDHVQSWITYFTQRDRDRFQRFLDRGQPFKDVVENTLEENDLPAELYYLAMIESGFRTDAYSRAKAVGVWQFVAGTARRYGLRIDRHVDERKDPIRATEAAAKYLRDLYNVFGSWHLAMAAYNAGEIRVLRAIFKGRTRNFWELIQSNILPRETAAYVPKFLAVTLIGQNPEKYGFKISSATEPYPSLEAVEVPSSLELKQIAQISGINLNTLVKVNNHLNSARVPPGRSAYEVWIPAESAEKVRRLSQTLLRLVPRNTRTVASQVSPSGAGVHIVKRGDTLDGIARKYKLSIGHLMRINNLKSSRILTGMRIRIQAKTYIASNLTKYKVRRGDNLSLIAQRFKTSIRKIKIKNGLKRNHIFIGQVLKVEIPNL